MRKKAGRAAARRKLKQPIVDEEAESSSVNSPLPRTPTFNPRDGRSIVLALTARTPPPPPPPPPPPSQPRNRVPDATSRVMFASDYKDAEDEQIVNKILSYYTDPEEHKQKLIEISWDLINRFEAEGLNAMPDWYQDLQRQLHEVRLEKGFVDSDSDRESTDSSKPNPMPDN